MTQTLSPTAPGLPIDGARPTLRVLQSVRFSPADATYQRHLRRIDGGGIELRFFGWTRALFGRYDLFHLHWPEHVLGPRRGPLGAVKYLLARLLLRRLDRRRIPVVRTVHNIAPHAGAEDSWLADITRRFDTLTVGVIDLAPGAAALLPDVALRALIPHPTYREQFGDLGGVRRLPGKVLSFGLIKPYKGFDRLVRAFAGVTSPGATLTLVGGAADPASVRRLRRACTGDARVTLRLEFVPDSVLAAEIASSALVVLPYRFHSSGVALAALTCGTPILARQSDSARALAAEVGAGWVHTFDGELTAEAIERALQHRPSGAKSVADAPDLARRDPGLVAEAHRAFYRAVLARAR